MVKLYFHGSWYSQNIESTIEVVQTETMEILIRIIDGKKNKNCEIILDRPTAIKFHRELKKQISFITPSSDASVWDDLINMISDGGVDKNT